MDQRNQSKQIWAHKERIILLCTTLIVFIINIRHLGSLGMLTVLEDEFGYWGNAAYLAGLDWSGVISAIPYYSYGYSLLLVPLFFIFDNPIHMYKAAILLNGIVLSASFLLTYDIARRLAKSTDKKILVFIAFLISMYPAYVAYSSIAWGECLLIFSIWLLTWCFMDLNETSSNYKFILIGFLSMYLYMIHQRALGVLIASIIVIIVLKVLGKIKLKQVLLVALTLIVLVFIHIYLKENIQTHLWLNSSGNLTNDYLSQASKIVQIFSIDGLIGLIKTFLGHVFYVGAASYLLGYFGLYELFRKVSRTTIISFRNRDLEVLSCNYHFSIYTFLLMAMLFSLAINIIFMINPNRIDHLVYGRYIDMLMGPIILMGLIALMGAELNRNRLFGKVSVIIIVLAVAVKFIVDASGLRLFAFQNAVGLLLMSYPLGILLSALTAILVCRFIIVTFTQTANRMVAISLMVVSLCFFVTGDNVARNTAVYNQSSVDLIDIVEFIENANERIPVYFVWDDQGNPAYGKWDHYNAGPLRIAESYQFLLKDIPVKLINKTELRNIEEKNFIITPNREFLSDLDKDYRLLLENKYSYLLVYEHTSNWVTSDLIRDMSSNGSSEEN